MRCARCAHASTACCRAASKPGGTTRGKRRWGDGDATCAAHNLKLLRRCEAIRASGLVVARRSTLVPVAQGLPRVVHSCRARGFGEPLAHLPTPAHRAVPLPVPNELHVLPDITARSHTEPSIYQTPEQMDGQMCVSKFKSRRWQAH